MEMNENSENGTEQEKVYLQNDKSDDEKDFDDKPQPFQVWPTIYAGFWMRFWAYLLDLIIIGSLNRLLLKPVFHVLDIPTFDFKMFSSISVMSAILFYLYFVLMTKWAGQTLGKMVFGLKVVDLKNGKLSWGTVLFREWIGRFISSTILIGYIMVAFLPKKQGLHDVFADTSVIHVER
jgi:uncharacterized RDD family membrane protein YckC